MEYRSSMDIGTRNTHSPTGTSSEHPRRYLIVLNDIGFLYSHFWTLATTVQLAGWDIFVAARSGASPQRAINAGMQFIQLRLKVGIGGPLAEINSALAVRRAIRSCDPDLVHLVSLKNVLIGGLLMRNCKDTSLIGAITGLGTLFVEKRILYSVLRPMVMRGLKRVFQNPRSVMALENPDDRNFFIETGVVKTESSFVIPGAGLDLDAAGPVTRRNDVPIVLCVSRMIRNKGILQLVEAARILHREGLRFELLLVGDIDEDNPTSLTREELRSSEVDGTAKWLGKRLDVPELLNNADIFCLPTYYREGLPRALVEASAAGCAIVTTDVPGCRDVVVDGVNGRLVPPRQVDGLVDALRSLLSNPEARKQMGIESRRRFEQHFTSASVLAAFNKCYTALDIPLRVSQR
jgi:glycosyltransferase involved in cell wall biosynthesis